MQSDGDTNTSGRSNPTESLIEREIRLQKEREEALANERRQALLLANQNKLPVSSGSVRKPEATPLAPPAPPAPSAEVSSAELRISEEIRELKRREEELRRMREASASRTDPEGMDSDHMPSMSTSGDEGLYSDADAQSDERDVSEPNSRFFIYFPTFFNRVMK